jgi:DNA modification methylase
MNNVLINGDFRDYEYPKGITITDPPYNQNYHYGSYKDKLKNDEYLLLLSGIKKPCVIIHYPEETINLLPNIFGKCEQVVSWVYNSNTGKQHRLISWWGCKPDFSKLTQPYKNPNDKRVKRLIESGRMGAKLYDWWEIQQIKNVSKEKTEHPCQIPEEVIKRILLTTVNKNETVVDPFSGSGTVLKVANDFGYKSIGYEIDTNYCNIIKERLKPNTNENH